MYVVVDISFENVDLLHYLSREVKNTTLHRHN